MVLYILKCNLLTPLCLKGLNDEHFPAVKFVYLPSQENNSYQLVFYIIERCLQFLLLSLYFAWWVYDAVAPLAEQQTCDSQVAGSSPGEYDLVPAKWGLCGWESNCGPGGK